MIDAACAASSECALWFSNFEAGQRRCTNSVGADCSWDLFCYERSHRGACSFEDISDAVAETCSVVLAPGSGAIIYFEWEDDEHVEPEHSPEQGSECEPIEPSEDSGRDWRTDLEMIRENKQAALEELRTDNAELKRQLDVYKGLLAISRGRTCFGPSISN